MTKKRGRHSAGSGGQRSDGMALRVRTRRPYPLEGRVRAVRSVVEGGSPVKDAARAFGVCISTLAVWLRCYRADGIEGLRAPRSGSRGDRSRDPGQPPGDRSVGRDRLKREAVKEL